MGQTPRNRRSKAAELRERPRIRDRERTRRQLLQAGLSVLSRDGYGAARVEDIAAEAGVSRATFYLHFSSKKELAGAIMDSFSTVHWEEKIRLLDALGDFTWDELRAWLSDLASWFKEHTALNSVVIATLASEPEFSATWFEDDVSLAGHLTHYLVKNGHNRDTAQLRIVVLIEGTSLVLHLWKVDDVEADGERLLDALTDVWWSVLRNPEPIK